MSLLPPRPPFINENHRMSSLLSGVSIVICCYNSAQKLPPTLRHLAAQRVPYELPWELVLVDNASSDGTSQVASSVWEQLGSPVPLRIVSEPRPGTDNARRAGVFAALYDIILFCDDDNWLSPNYLYTGWQYLQSHPEVGLVGGQAEAVADVPIPEWFASVAPYYAACAPAFNSCERTLEANWSAGMFGRCSLLRLALAPDVPLLNAGRVGENTGLGEDSEICIRVALCNYKIFYIEELQFKHYLSTFRLTEEYRDSLLNCLHEPSLVRATYCRLFFYERKRPLQQKVYGMYHLLKLLFWHMLFGKGDVTFSKDFAYFFSGSKGFETKYNKIAKGYLRFVLNCQHDSHINI